MKSKKRILALLLAVVTVFTMLPFSASAAEGYLTLQLMPQYSYSFNSSFPAPYAGVTRGSAGKLGIGGEVAYCIEFGREVVGGTGYDSSTYYDSLSDSQKTMLQYALMFGFTGTSRYGYGEYPEYFATAVLIWLICSGHLNTSWEAPITNVFFGSDSSARGAYDAIKNNVMNFRKIPSFTSGVNNPTYTPTHEMTYNRSTGLYEVTLNDSNGVLSAFNFSHSGYSMTRSGNSLKITSSNPQELITVSSPKNLPGHAAGYVKYWSAGSSYYQRIATLAKTMDGYDPVNAYFKLKIATGNIEIDKSTEDDEIVQGTVFTVTAVDRPGNYEIIIGSDNKGRLDNLPIGEYRISEKENSNYPQYVVPEPQTVTVLAGKTITVDFFNELKKGQISILKLVPPISQGRDKK